MFCNIDNDDTIDNNSSSKHRERDHDRDYHRSSRQRDDDRHYSSRHSEKYVDRSNTKIFFSLCVRVYEYACV